MRTKSEDILSQLSVNLIGPMYTCKVALRSMVQQQGGAIVNIGKWLLSTMTVLLANSPLGVHRNKNVKPTACQTLEASSPWRVEIQSGHLLAHIALSS